MNDQTLTLRYLDVIQDLPARAIYHADDAIKDKALQRLGIERQPGVNHLVAWTLAMCRENGLPERLPADVIGAAVAQDRTALAFIWWLA